MKSKQQQGFAHVALIAAIVVILAAGGVGYFVFKNNNDKKSTNTNAATTSTSASSSTSSKEADEKAVKAAAKAHLALVYQKKTQEAYDTTCQEFKDLTTYSAFQSQLEQGGYYSLDLSAIEYTSVEVRNNQAKISGPIGPLQPGTDLAVSLLKKDSKWCVYGYQAQ